MPSIAGHEVLAETVGSGPPAVMIHAMLARHSALMPLAGALPFRTTLFDLPGHGGSGKWDGQREYQALTADIAAHFCDGPTHLIGHSFGGTAALRLAIRRPDLVNRLTLIEPVYFAAARGTQAHTDHARAFRPFITAMLAGEEARAAQIFNDLWSGTRWSDLSPRRQADLTARIYLVVASAAAIEEDADGIVSPEQLSVLDIPVTLIRGADSPDVVRSIHEVLTDRINGATDHVVDGAGHMLPMTHADQVAKIIRATATETG